MKAAKERAIQDKGGVPLEEGEKWLLTTKACHDLLNDRAEYRRKLVAHETKVEEFKMVRRGNKTLPGDLVCDLMTDTMAHRLLRDDETGLGGKNLRQELLKKESEVGDVAHVIMAANRFKNKGRAYGNSAAQRRAKKKKEKEDVPRYGYPTFTYLEPSSEHNKTCAVGDEKDIKVVQKDMVVQEDIVNEEDIKGKVQINMSSEIEGSKEDIEHQEVEGITNVTAKTSEDRHHHQVLNHFKQVAHKGLSQKKLRDCRLRMILPVGDEDTKEQVFWEKVGVPRVIPGQEKPIVQESKPQHHWWEKDGGSSVDSHHSVKSHGTTSDETLMQTKAKIRMNRETGWRPGLLRHVDVVDDDPADWMRRARQQRTVAKQNGDPLESLFWESEGKPSLPDPFSISNELSQFLNLTKRSDGSFVENASSKKDRDKQHQQDRQDRAMERGSRISDNETDSEESEEALVSNGFKGTFKWIQETVDSSSGNAGGMSGKAKSCPDGRVHHTLTAFPSCWAPKKASGSVDWLRPGMSLVFMFGGRRFHPPKPARRGDPTKGRYRPSPTTPTNELWSYTPQLYKWQNLTDFCKGKGPGPRSRHTTAIVRESNSQVNLLVFGGLDLHNNCKNDLFLLDLTSLCWTEVQLRGVPPPNGLGAACMTESGKDIIVTKDKDVAAETDAERKNGIPSAMAVWRLKLSSSPEEKYSSKQVWLGLWSRAPRRLPPHGAGHTVSTLGRSQVVFGGLAAKTGDVVSMALGALKVLGKGSGFGNPILEANSIDNIKKKHEIVEGRKRNRERRKRRHVLDQGNSISSDGSDSEEDDREILKGTDMRPFDKHLEPLPSRLGKGAGAIGSRLIATPDPKRAIRYTSIAGSEEDGRFRNPLRDGLEHGCLGLVNVKDVSKNGMRKLLCASDKKLHEIKVKEKKSKKSILTNSTVTENTVGSGGGGIDVGGSSLDDWLRMTEKDSEESGGLGGRGQEITQGVGSGGGGDISDMSVGMANMGLDSSTSDVGDELTLVHHQTLLCSTDRQSQVHLEDSEEEVYDSIGSLAAHKSTSHHDEFGKGAVWEPASWVRPWAKAGIKRLIDPPKRQYHAAAAVSKRHLVVCGGELGGPLNENVSEDSEFRYRVSSGVYILDLQTSEWSQLPVCNPVRRAGHALVCVDGKLLSFGGRSAPLPATKPFPMDLLCLHYDG